MPLSTARPHPQPVDSCWLPLLHNRCGIKMIEKCVSPLQGPHQSRRILGCVRDNNGKEGALGTLCPGAKACILLPPPTGPSGCCKSQNSWSGMNLFPALSDFLGLIQILHAADGTHLSLGLGAPKQSFHLVTESGNGDPVGQQMPHVSPSSPLSRSPVTAWWGGLSDSLWAWPGDSVPGQPLGRGK